MSIVYWLQRRTEGCYAIFLLLIFRIALPVVIVNNSCNAAATTKTRTLNTDNSIRSTNREVLESRLNSAVLDYINKFGPLPSSFQVQQETHGLPVTADSTTTATTNASTADIQQRTPPHQQRASVGDFFMDLYYSILNPTLRCRIGLPSTCICQEDDLRRAIVRAGTSFDNPTPITLCAVTITLQDSNVRHNNKNDFQPINVTNKSFFIGCQAKNPKILPKFRKRATCVISGNGQQTIFHGNPIQLFLQNIQLINSYASLSTMNNKTANGNTTTTSSRRDFSYYNNTGMGGAIHLTGGKTFIDSVIFRSNVATIGGGAIYVGPTAQLTIASANFYNNFVTNKNVNNTNNTEEQLQPNIDKIIGGGALYIDGGVVIAAKGVYKENTVDTGYGGAVYAVEASIRLEDIEFEDNVANRDGGAVAVNRSIMQFASTTFEVNTALNGNGNALFIGDDLDDAIDGSYVYCDPIFSVSFCYGFDDGTAIYELPGGNHSNTNCQEVGLSDIFSERCPNYIP
jgi:predicted outer membrane repeat protein